MATCKKMKSFMKENDIRKPDEDPKEGMKGAENKGKKGGRNDGRKRVGDGQALQDETSMQAIKVKQEAQDSEIPAPDTDAGSPKLISRAMNIKVEDEISSHLVPIQSKRDIKRPRKTAAAAKHDAKKTKAHLAAQRPRLAKAVKIKENATPSARGGTPEKLKGYVPNKEFKFKYVTFEQEEESNARAEPDTNRLIKWR